MTRSASLRGSSPECAAAGDTAAEWPFLSFLTCAVRWHTSSLGWRLIQCKFIAPEILKSHLCGSAPTTTTTTSRKSTPRPTSPASAPSAPSFPRLVLQQNAGRPPPRPAAGLGPPPARPFAPTAPEFALQKVARPHPSRLVCGPPALSRLPKSHAHPRRRRCPPRRRENPPPSGRLARPAAPLSPPGIPGSV